MSRFAVKEHGFALGLITLVFVLFRIPPLLNAKAIHSDAAIVGLQAMHLLQGEWARLIWGTQYQGIVEPLLIAAVFALTGPSAWSVMLVPILGHWLVVLGTYVALCRFLPRRWVIPLTLILVFTPTAVNMFGLLPPRQWSVTLLMLAAVSLLLTGPNSAWRKWKFLGAGLLGVSSLYLDLFTLQMLPGLAILGLGLALGAESWRARLGLVLVCGAGAYAGYELVEWLRQAPVLAARVTEVDRELVTRNGKILWETALPWLLGYGVYVPGDGLYPDLWKPSVALAVFQWVGGLSLVVGGVASALVSLIRPMPFSARLAGWFGLTVIAGSVAGYLVSPMVYDMWSVRYLAPVIWGAPFAWVPLAVVLARYRRMSLLLVPYLVVAALGGWVSYGPFVKNGIPAFSERGVARDEEQLKSFLHSKNVRFGSAQYWLSYRLTFLFKEDVIIVPLEPGERRYWPYDRDFAAAPIKAYIFHPDEPRARASDYVARVTPPETLEQHQVAGFTVLLTNADLTSNRRRAP